MLSPVARRSTRTHLLDCLRMHSLRAALAGLIDYAGLFPPASLDLPRVAANHARYARSDERWLLGRLVVPLARLDELSDLIGEPYDLAGEPLDAPAPPWTVSVLVRPDDPLDGLAARVGQFNERSGATAAVVAVELAASDLRDVRRIIAGEVPERFERYVEVPLGDALPGLLDAVAEGGCYAKVRTGGVTADAFPAAAALAQFMSACLARDVPFKATAGLHHPIRGSYRLTYEPQSPSAVMHGFVNLTVAAGLMAARRIDGRDAARILETVDPAAFRPEPDGIRWREHVLGVEECVAARAHVLRSVGSCSFEDAVTDLRRLGWIAGDVGEPAGQPR